MLFRSDRSTISVFDVGTTINQKIDAVESEIPTVSYPVTSVNSKTGDVVLDGNDIAYGGGLSVNQKINAVESEIPAIPVTSVNGETGAVVLDANDIEYSAGVSVKSKIDAVESEIPTSDTEIEHTTGTTVNSIINTIIQYTPVYGNTASGALATFDTSLALPLQDCTIAINAVQESGTPTPSSPKLISGFTGANIYSRGANLWNEVWEVGTINNSTGADSPSNDTWRCVGYIPVTPSTAYYVVNTKNVSLRYYFYDINKTFISSNTVGNSVLTTTDKTFYMRIRSVLSEGATYTNNVSINYPATDTAYHAYNANSTTTAISWQDEAGTIYGGSRNVTTGVLTVTHGIKQLNGTENTWNSSTTYDFMVDITEMESGNYLAGLADWLVTAINTSTPLSVRFGANNKILYFYGIIGNLTGVTDLATWKTYLSNNPLTVIFPLETPVTYQLTPTQINAIVGTNNVFTDTNGNTSVIYAKSLSDLLD